jgi:hypothetical protein
VSARLTIGVVITVFATLTSAGCSNDADRGATQSGTSPATDKPELPAQIVNLDELFITLSKKPCDSTLVDGVTKIVDAWAGRQNVAPADISVETAERTGPTGLAQCAFAIDLPDSAATWTIDKLTVTALPVASNVVRNPIGPPPPGLNIPIFKQDNDLSPRTYAGTARLGADAIALAAETAMAATGVEYSAVSQRDKPNVDHGTISSPTWWAHVQTADYDAQLPQDRHPVSGYLVEATFAETPNFSSSSRFKLPRAVQKWFDGTLDDSAFGNP